jgi:excisionase family DNA binding protein
MATQSVSAHAQSPISKHLAATVDEFAAAAGIHLNTAYARVADGTIPVIRMGRRILIPRAAMDQLITGIDPGAA